MARRKPEDIVALVNAHYDATEPLRQRMQDDHELYRLEPYDAGEGYQSYTSNDPIPTQKNYRVDIRRGDDCQDSHDGADRNCANATI